MRQQVERLIMVLIQCSAYRRTVHKPTKVNYYSSHSLETPHLMLQQSRRDESSWSGSGMDANTMSPRQLIRGCLGKNTVKLIPKSQRVRIVNHIDLETKGLKPLLPTLIIYTVSPTHHGWVTMDEMARSWLHINSKPTPLPAASASFHERISCDQD